MTEERIKALIIQYDDSVRYRKRLLDYNFAEKLLSVIPTCLENQQAMETQLNKKINECKRLKEYLEKAENRVSKLYSQFEKNTQLKEFLDFAVFLTTFRESNEHEEAIAAVDSIDDDELLRRYDISLEGFGAEELINDNEDELKNLKLQFEEIRFECKRLKISLNLAIEDITKLNSKLKQVESERDSLNNLSEKLSGLIYKFCHCGVDEMNARVVNHSNETKEPDSNSIPTIDDSLMEDDCDDNLNNELPSRVISKQSFYCANCSKAFRLNNGVGKCPTCDKHFSIKIIADIKSTDVDDIFTSSRDQISRTSKCTESNRLSPETRSLGRPAERDENQEPSKCAICDQNSNHDENYRCLHCDEEFI